MSSKVFKSIFAVAISTLIVTLLIISALMYSYFGGVQDKHLQDQLEIAANGTEISGEMFLSTLEGESYRVTWIDKDGVVLFDNKTDKSKMENHSDREEFEEAIEFGTGRSSRYSTTLTEKTLYEARKLDDGTVLRISESRATAALLMVGMLQPILIIAILCTILSAVLARRMSKRIVEPLNHLDLENPLDNDVYEEISPLLRRINSQNHELKAQLKDLNRKKEELTANVSHELKTPLQGILGYTDLIANGLAKPDDVPKFISQIRKEATRLVALIDDIISLSRLDEGFELELTEVSLNDIAKDVCDSLEDAALAKNITLNESGSAGTIEGVYSLLHEIIYNLCDNAIKYHDGNGHVDISIEESDDTATVTVKDDGIGIAPEHLNSIFERFYRVDKSHSRQSGGTGLGLSIVKHAVSILGGEIKISSELGEGTEISVIFKKTN